MSQFKKNALWKQKKHVWLLRINRSRLKAVSAALSKYLIGQNMNAWYDSVMWRRRGETVGERETATVVKIKMNALKNKLSLRSCMTRARKKRENKNRERGKERDTCVEDHILFFHLPFVESVRKVLVDLNLIIIIRSRGERKSRHFHSTKYIWDFSFFFFFFTKYFFLKKKKKKT